MQKGYKYSVKRLWYNNGEEETLVYETDTPPDGYVRGRLKRGFCWNRGLTKDTNVSLAKMSISKKGKSNNRYNNRVQYLKDRFSDPEVFMEYWKTHTCTDCVKYFNISWDDLYKIIDIFNLESPKEHLVNIYDYIYTDEFRLKHSQSLKGKNTWSKGRKISEDAKIKCKETWKHKPKELIQSYKKKEFETRRSNGTLGQHKTSAEMELENILISIFGKDDVMYNYFDDRYPFKCDFYVKSEDLFIELHAGWEHQHHSFDEGNEDDLHTLKILQDKSLDSDYFSNVIYQWTDLDVRKKNTFIENKLNYIIGYSVDEVYENIKDKINKKEILR